MQKQIILDGVEGVGINLFKAGGTLRVEVNYSLLSAGQPVQMKASEITNQLPPELLGALSQDYDAVFSVVKNLELA